MKTLPDKSIDLFVCDLPYGCLEPKRKRTEEYLKETKHSHTGGCSWDIPIDLTEFWVQIERLMKDDHTPIIHFCNARFGFDLYNSKPDWFRYDLIWEKTNAVGFLLANKMPMRSHENIYVFAKKGARYNRIDIDVEGAKEWKQFGKVGVSGVYDLVRENPVIRPVGTITSKAGVRCVKSVITIENKKGKGNHPTQKPADLYAWLIERYSKEGDTILDPTAGSFTSIFTAHKLNRNAIGIEKDATFYQKGLTNECIATG
jgi:DNA modification methylase